MNIPVLVWSIIWSMIPISELRGGIPYAYFNKITFGNGYDIYVAFAVCVAANILLGPIVIIFLSTINKLLVRWKPYKDFFERFVERARNKVHKQVEKYGYLGLAVFVGIPLPVTGAVTGALGAWVLGMNKVKSCIAIAYGVLIAGIVVSIVVLGGEHTFNFIFRLFTTTVAK